MVSKLLADGSEAHSFAVHFFLISRMEQSGVEFNRESNANYVFLVATHALQRHALING